MEAQKANNRAVTLDGQNKIFGVIGIKISKSESLGFYESSGAIQMQAKTLTELCQKLVTRLKEGV